MKENLIADSLTDILTSANTVQVEKDRITTFFSMDLKSLQKLSEMPLLSVGRYVIGINWSWRNASSMQVTEYHLILRLMLIACLVTMNFFAKKGLSLESGAQKTLITDLTKTLRKHFTPLSNVDFLEEISLEMDKVSFESIAANLVCFPLSLFQTKLFLPCLLHLEQYVALISTISASSVEVVLKDIFKVKEEKK